MRDKTLALITATLAPFDSTVDNVVGQFRQQFEQGFGEIPPEASEAITAIEGALRGGKDIVVDRVAVVLEVAFTEEDMDSILLFFGSPAGAKMQKNNASLQTEIAEITQTWIQERMKTVEPRLMELLGAPAAASDDTGGNTLPDVSGEIAGSEPEPLPEPPSAA